MRVLVADDQVAVRSALRRFLFEEPEFQMVGEAVGIEELLVQAEQNRPDLVLLDWELPGVPKGVRSDRDIGSNEWSHQSQVLGILHGLNSHLKVIVISERPETLQLALGAGADAFVCKADPPDRLLEILRACKAGIRL